MQNKKLGSRDFIKKLETLESSKTHLELFVNEWLGKNEQLDDITILLLSL